MTAIGVAYLASVVAGAPAQAQARQDTPLCQSLKERHAALTKEQVTQLTQSPAAARVLRLCRSLVETDVAIAQMCIAQRCQYEDESGFAKRIEGEGNSRLSVCEEASQRLADVERRLELMRKSMAFACDRQ